MALDPTDSRPPFRQIADALRAAIAAGTYLPGSRLPSERELVERFGTAHATVRQALTLLKTEGLIVTRQGRGAFVRTVPLRLRLVANHQFVTEARRQGRTAEARLLSVETVPAPDDIAEHLTLPPGSSTVVRRYLLQLDGEPAQYDESYWPAELVGATAIASHDHLSPGRIDRILAQEVGRPLRSFRDELVPRMPTPHESRALRLLPGTPVVDLTRTFYDEAREPVEVGRVVIAGDKHILIYDMDVPNPAPQRLSGSPTAPDA